MLSGPTINCMEMHAGYSRRFLSQEQLLQCNSKSVHSTQFVHATIGQYNLNCIRTTKFTASKYPLNVSHRNNEPGQ